MRKIPEASFKDVHPSGRSFPDRETPHKPVALSSGASKDAKPAKGNAIAIQSKHLQEASGRMIHEPIPTTGGVGKLG